jgi:UDP-N-acetylmuramoyl-tripeptide--D-alanyl-D-alanine ligase
LKGSHQIAIIEMGANHIGEIDHLCNIAMPDHGLITNIGSAHLEGFGSPEGVRKAKSELFRYLKKTGGRAFLNTLRPELMNFPKRYRLTSYSFRHRGGMFC